MTPARRSPLERAAFLLLPVLAVTMFPRALVGQATFFHYDTWLQNLTFRAWWFDQLRHGHFATWCPGMFAGYPLFAETQTGPLYPPTFLLFSCLPATLAFSWSVILHFAFAGVGAYLVARRLGAGPAGALYAGASFELSGFLVTHVVHFNLLVGAAWMPWVALFAVGAAERRRRSLVALTLAIAALLLGAHPYATLMNLALAATVLLACVGGRPRPLALGVVTLAGIGLLAACLAAVQVIPTGEFLARTTRGTAVDWSFLTFGSFPPWNVFTLAAPDLYGTPVNDTFWAGPDWSHFSETCAYVGLLTVALAVVALVLRRDRATALLAVIALVSGLLMLGRYTPVYRLLTTIPLFESTRLPGRFALPATFAITMLAGLGLDALTNVTRRRRPVALAAAALVVLTLCAGAWRESAVARHPDPELTSTGRAWPERMERIHGAADIGTTRLAVVGLGTLLLLGALAGRSPKRSTPVVLLATIWTVGELFTWGRSFNPVIDPAAVNEPPPVVEALRGIDTGNAPRPRVFRQGVDEQWSRRAGLPRVDLVTPGWKGREAGYRTGAWTLPPNSQLLYDVDSGEGFTSLLPLEWLEWMGLARQPGAAPRPDLTEAQADLMSIDAVISTGAGIGGEHWIPSALPGDVWWSRNEDPMPRVRLAGSWRTVGSRAELLEELRASGYDPRNAVLLESAPPGKPAVTRNGPVDEALPARETGPGRWEVEVPSGRDGIVVIAESFDPDWIAETGDGTRLPVFRAEGLFLAVSAPPTGGILVLRHAPDALRQGVILSLVGVLLLLGLSWFARRVAPVGAGGLSQPTSGWVTFVTFIAFAVCIVLSAVADVGNWKADRTRSTLDAAAVRAWSGEAQGAFLSGALEGAETLLQAAVRRAPRDAGIHYRLGLVQRQAGRRAMAAESFERALREDPGLDAARIALREMEQIVR